MFRRKCILVCIVMFYIRYSECFNGIKDQSLRTESVTVGDTQRLEQKSVVEIECTDKQSDESFTIITANGTVIDATYSCAPPEYLYNGTLVGWIPEFVLTYIAEVRETTQAIENQTSTSPRLFSPNNISSTLDELDNNPAIATTRRLLSDTTHDEVDVNSIPDHKHDRMMMYLDHYSLMHDTHSMHPDNQHIPNAYDVERRRHEDTFQEMLKTFAADGDIDPLTELHKVYYDLVVHMSTLSPAKRRLLDEVSNNEASGLIAAGGGILGGGVGVYAMSSPVGMIAMGAMAGAALSLASSNAAAINHILDALKGLDSAVQELKANVNDLENARVRMDETLNRYNARTDNLFANITTTAEDVFELGKLQNIQGNTVNEKTNKNFAAINQLYQAASANHTYLKDLIAGTSDLIIQQTELALQREDTFTDNLRFLSRVVRNVTRSAAEARDELATDFIDQISDLDADIRFNLQSIKTLATILFDGQSDIETQRVFAGMIQSVITQFQSFKLSDESLDYSFVPFVRNSGTSPLTTDDPQYAKYAYFPMDTVTVISRGWDNSQQTLSNTRIYQDSYTLNCMTEQVVGKTDFAFEWNDIVKRLGPAGCTPQNNVDIINGTGVACDCFIDRKKSHCDVTDDSAYTGDSSVMDTFFSFEEDGIPAGCTTPVEEELDEPVIRTIDDVYEALYDICVTGDYDNGHNLRSGVLRNTWVELESLHENKCVQPLSGIDTRTSVEKGVIIQDILNERGDSFGVNVVSSFFHAIVKSRALQPRREGEWESNHFGDIPSDVHFDTVPFSGATPGETYSTGKTHYATICFTAPTDPATALPAPYIPVYSFTNVRTDGYISVTIDGVTTETTGQTTDEWSKSLPAKMTFIGNPHKIIESGLTSFVYDIRESEASISRTTNNRKSHVTYLMINADEDDSSFVPTDKFHSLDSWMADNSAAIFDASAATNSLHLHARTIQRDPSVTNRYTCAESNAEDGILCHLLDHYFLDAPDDTIPGADTKILLTAHEFVTTGSIVVPIGEIVVNIISDCLPTVTSLELSTDLFTKRVSFNNPTSSQSQVCMHTYNPDNPTDPECNKYTIVSVPASSTSFIAFPRCAANTTTPNNLVLKQYLLDTDTGCSATTILTQTTCNAVATQLTSESDEIVASNIPQVSVIRAEAYAVTDVTASRLSESIDLTSEGMFEAYKIIRVLAEYNNIDFDQFTDIDVSKLLDVANKTNILASTLRNQLDAVGKDVFNQTGFVKGFEEDEAAFVLNDIKIEGAIAELEIDFANLQIGLALRRNITAQVTSVMAEVTEATVKAFNTITGALQQLVTAGKYDRLEGDGLGGIIDAVSFMGNAMLDGLEEINDKILSPLADFLNGWGNFFGGILAWLMQAAAVAVIALVVCFCLPFILKKAKAYLESRDKTRPQQPYSQVGL